MRLNKVMDRRSAVSPWAYTGLPEPRGPLITTSTGLRIRFSALMRQAGNAVFGRSRNVSTSDDHVPISAQRAQNLGRAKDAEEQVTATVTLSSAPASARVAHTAFSAVLRMQTCLV
jgi:hypothetical protein